MNTGLVALLEVKNQALLDKLNSLAAFDSTTIGKYNPATAVISLFNTPFALKTARIAHKQVRLYRRAGEAYALDERGPVVAAHLCPLGDDYDYRAEEGAVVRRKTARLEKPMDLNNLPRSKLHLITETVVVSRKKEEDEIKKILFEMFTEKPQMSFDEIQAVVDQPRNYLQKIIDSICDKRKEQNRFVYTLKTTYMVNADEGAGKKLKRV